MQISRLQWLLALAGAGLAHLLLLTAFFIGEFTHQAPMDTPEGVMISLDRLDPGPPPAAVAAEAPVDAPTPQVESANAPSAAQVGAPEASNAVLPDAPQAVANIGPTPAESAAPPSDSAPQSAADRIERAPAAAPAIEPANAVAVAPINMADTVPVVEQVTARSPEIAPTQTRAADSNANGAFGDSAQATDDYLVRVRAWLSRHKEYPQSARRAKAEGTVRIYLVVDQSGRIVTHRITRSSGSPLLDRAAEQMLARAEPLPGMPSAMQRNRLELVVPIVFSLR